MLYVVATPIGNLSEITHRAIEVLKSVDVIAAEDTRHTLVLLKNYGITTPMIAYHKFNEKKMLPQLIERLKNGENVALVSDAGMPLVSDPGGYLINELKNNSIPYTVVSGACALINALVLSGMDTSSFYFAGFLPEKNIDKNRKLEGIESLSCPIIFYSSVHNVKDDLDFLFTRLGNRKVAIVREITKIYEEVVTCNLGEIPEFTQKGEFVLVVDGAPPKTYDDMSVEEHMQMYLDQGFSKKDSIKKVASDRGVAKSVIYKQVMQEN